MPRAIRSSRPSRAARYKALRDRPACSAVLGLNVGATSANERYLRAKRDLLGHTLPDGGVEVPHRGPHHRVDNW